MTETPPPPTQKPFPKEARQLRLPAPSKTLQRRARSFLALFFIIAALWTLRNMLPALLWGCIFAIALWPLYKRATKRFGTSIWLPLSFTAILALVFLVPVSFISLKIADEVSGALLWVDQIRHQGIPTPNWVDRLPIASAQVKAFWAQHLNNPDTLNELVHSLRMGRGVAFGKQFGSEILHRGILFVFSLLTLFFLLKDSESIIRKCLIGSQRLFGAQGETLARQIISSIHGTVSGLVLVGLGEGAIIGVCYIIAGAPQPLIFGLATAIAAMVPLLGWIAVTGVCFLIAFKGSMLAAVIVWLIGAIVLFIADHFIRPILIGGSTKVPFLWVLLGILGGAETWHLMGLFLGPAIMAGLHMLWSLWTSNKGPGLRVVRYHRRR
ncbi:MULTISPECIES: AI-2E family transporter [Bombella]|uniref:AI-2E family transporter n=1 Tax=Bombella saccharophila TaxID=2967338 RepID=A0ABT3W5G8_9PROT|nr:MULTISPECIES: AI-2E family transporter [Bombella]MCT6855656.1 AI-2E family transporter [Bombella apis]PHI95390.1 AI-2E family transporter [Parasaccharibacter apium]MCX5614319.1 AI-2E family transporter [Bombella saccharophila]MUG04840.1 AI-2E family transporter [Bombella sp. ESL0378]MUG90381.1 AI-2E family transporter [Bombella sp. ESL0385]